MGFWQRFKASLGSAPRQGTGLEVARFEAAPPRRGSQELIKAYREMPYLRLCVETASDGVAGVCWTAHRRVKGGQTVKDYSLRTADAPYRRARLKSLLATGEAVEVPDHPVLQLLSDPSDVLTGRAVTKLQQTYLDLVGDGFLAVEFRGTVPVGLWPIPAHWVSRLPDLRRPLAEQFYVVTTGSKYIEIPAANVIHLRNHDPDDPLARGIGPAFALGDELDTDEYAARFVKNAFYRGMVPSTVVGLEGMNDSNGEAVKRWKESLMREHGGPENAGKILVTNGKTTFARLDTSLKDMDFIPLRKFLMDFVRMAYRIPPEIVANMASSNKATAYASREIFAEQCIQPRMEFLRTEYQKRLVPLLGDDIILDYESPVPEDREFTLRVMGTLPAGFSYDEWRGLAGQKPDANLQGYPAPLPGQKPDQAQPTPDAQQGSAADAREEVAEPDSPKGVADPPWARVKPA